VTFKSYTIGIAVLVALFGPATGLAQEFEGEEEFTPWEQEQEQVQIQTEMVEYHQQQAAVLHDDLEDIRWKLIVLRFTHLDERAAEHGWYYRAPSPESRLYDEYLHWAYMVVHWDVLEAGFEPGSKEAAAFLRRKREEEAEAAALLVMPKVGFKKKKPSAGIRIMASVFDEDEEEPEPEPEPPPPKRRDRRDIEPELPKGYKPGWKK
jgi:hypothetical protein